jgi:hypothetical protein
MSSAAQKISSYELDPVPIQQDEFRTNYVNLDIVRSWAVLLVSKLLRGTERT